jgi:hypothetical protein
LRICGYVGGMFRKVTHACDMPDSLFRMRTQKIPCASSQWYF